MALGYGGSAQERAGRRKEAERQIELKGNVGGPAPGSIETETPEAWRKAFVDAGLTMWIASIHQRSQRHDSPSTKSANPAASLPPQMPCVRPIQEKTPGSSSGMFAHAKTKHASAC